MEQSAKTDQKDSEYRSPKRVLARFFEKSRDLWKAKYMELQDRVKAFRTEVRDLRRASNRWRAKAEGLEREVKELRSRLEQQAEQSPPAPSQRTFPIVTQRLS